MDQGGKLKSIPLYKYLKVIETWPPGGAKVEFHPYWSLSTRWGKSCGWTSLVRAAASLRSLKASLWSCPYASTLERQKTVIFKRLGK